MGDHRDHCPNFGLGVSKALQEQYDKLFSECVERNKKLEALENIRFQAQMSMSFTTVDHSANKEEHYSQGFSMDTSSANPSSTSASSSTRAMQLGAKAKPAPKSKRNPNCHRPKLVPTNEFEARIRVQRDKKIARDCIRKQKRWQEQDASNNAFAG